MFKEIDVKVHEQFEDLQSPGLPDILVETIDSFLKTSEQRMQRVQIASARQDWAVVSAEAHAMKSVALMLGANNLGSLCEQAEGYCKDPSRWPLLGNVVQELVRSFELSSIELRQIRAERVSKN